MTHGVLTHTPSVRKVMIHDVSHTSWHTFTRTQHNCAFVVLSFYHLEHYNVNGICRVLSVNPVWKLREFDVCVQHAREAVAILRSMSHSLF